METIVPNQHFQHDGKDFQEGESYEVTKELALYFREAGWVGEEGSYSNGEISLDIHDGILGQSAEVN